jgi:hypothetical protein
MKYWLIVVLTLILVSCNLHPLSPSQADSKNTVSNLPNLGVAPELTNDIWLNIDQPLRLANLRGKVVLLDMWTFG